VVLDSNNKVPAETQRNTDERRKKKYEEETKKIIE